MPKPATWTSSCPSRGEIPRSFSTGTSGSKKTWRRSSDAGLTWGWRAPSKRAPASPRASRTAACCCMEAEERVLKALEDVQDCASFVVAASDGKDLAYYRRERLFRQAVERNLEIIGEAIGRII